MPTRNTPPRHHIPPDSWLHTRLVPALLAFLGLAAAGLILFAVGVLAGWVRW
jgi:hypothetical protein